MSVWDLQHCKAPYSTEHSTELSMVLKVTYERNFGSSISIETVSLNHVATLPTPIQTVGTLTMDCSENPSRLHHAPERDTVTQSLQHLIQGPYLRL